MKSHSYTELSTWHDCRQKHYFMYKRNIEAIRRPEALDYGSAIHVGLAEYYRSNFNLDKTNKAFVSSLVESWNNFMVSLASQGNEPEDEDNKKHNRMMDNGLLLLRKYHEFWSTKEWNYKVLDIEVAFKTPLVRIVDMIVEDKYGERWAWEHKTTSRNEVENLTMTTLSMEPALTTIASLAIGIVYNFLSKDKLSFWREELFITPPEKGIAIEWLANTRWEIENSASIIISRYDRNCAWCPYRPICASVIAGNTGVDIIDKGYQKRKERKEKD